MKVYLIGVLTKVGEVEQKSSHSQQFAELTISGFNTETGEPLKEQTFPFSVFNKKIKELNLLAIVNMKVRLTCYLKSLRSEKDGKVYHNIVLNSTAVEKIV